MHDSECICDARDARTADGHRFDCPKREPVNVTLAIAKAQRAQARATRPHLLREDARAA